MKKNDYFIGTCSDLTHDGRGVVKHENFTYFVPGMLINETGNIKVIKMLKNYGVGRLIELSIPSKHRQEPRCPVYKQCGGCSLQHLGSKGQQEFKTKRVRDALTRLGDCDVEVHDCLMMEDPWNYRNKVQMPVGMKNNHIVSGFYKAKTNEIVPTKSCNIQNVKSNKLVNRVVELMEQFKVNPYDKELHTGNIKHILTKHGYHTDELMLVLISFKRKIKDLDKIVTILIKEFPELKTIIHNFNPRKDNVILGDEETVIYGPGYIQDYLLGNLFNISAKSFYQVNPIQVEKLYQTAIDHSSITKDDVVLDAYCGIGTITLSLAKHVKKAYGVEIVAAAIDDAKNNAKVNNIENVEFALGDAGEYMMELVEKGTAVDVVFVDPPRKGCSQEFLDHLIKAKPREIVYISCDVATQARDIKYLQDHYRADYCQPVDMFPQSTHVECVVLMSRVEK
ncbi:MAG: 23S rRNA (uracil(1939)-C(5))-methyltransferase RlmD [Bacteroidales bacterium]|nr:23S rRNA (uracil(1939)-C(5))-methyltransferase RlmD [Bacteroidales bacterium]